MLKQTLEKFQISKQSFIIFCTCFAVFSYFILYTIFGHRGVLDYFKLRAEFQQQNLVKDQLFVTISDQTNLVNGMKNESLNLDLLDEQVRKNLGYAKKNEIIIYPDKIPNPKSN